MHIFAPLSFPGRGFVRHPVRGSRSERSNASGRSCKSGKAPRSAYDNGGKGLEGFSTWASVGNGTVDGQTGASRLAMSKG